ncbi:TPA: LacI family DNA-binding transcriptional regulator, partial [Vibrio cholerae]
MATINDVCKLAGVSKATVSRVLNETGQVKAQTREAVLAAMQQLGYQPNSLAQALATNTTNSIGLVLPHFESSYFGSILFEAEQGAQKAGKKLLVMNSKNSEQGEKEAVATLAAQRCDAILLYSRHL